MKDPGAELWLIRHGETEWSASGAHTSRTNIPLTDKGRAQAAAIRGYLKAQRFSMVITSPLLRARETCHIAGFDEVAQIGPELSEWDYGRYEGRTTEEIRSEIPGWSIWHSNPPGGQTLDEVGGRAEKVVAQCLETGGRIALFSHAHFLRILAAVWVGLPPWAGSLLAFHTGSISTLGFEHENRVIEIWNLSLETMPLPSSSVLGHLSELKRRNDKEATHTC